MMEWLGIGIMLAIGFYLAPVVITLVVGIVGAVGIGICKLFGGCK